MSSAAIHSLSLARPCGRTARTQDDPDRYIRPVKGGKFQARPHDQFTRYNLGLFHTRHAARKAVLEFWWGVRQPRLRFARPVKAKAGEWWIAVVRVPSVRDRKAGVPPGVRMESVRVGGQYGTAAEAHRAAVAWLVREVGPLVAWAMADGGGSDGSGPTGPETKQARMPLAA